MFGAAVRVAAPRCSCATIRTLTTGRTETITVFDRNAKLMQKERAAAREDIHLYDYLKEEVGYRLSERIHDIKNEFRVGLDLSCGRGQLAKHITETSLQKLYMSDFSPGLLAQAHVPQADGLSVEKLCINEESKLPFEDEHLDIVLSNLSLHWVNNLPGCLREVLRTLKRDGGISAHVSPFTETQDVGALLTNAGFTLLTVDTEDITVGYPSMFELMWDLQGMAENNANLSRQLHLSRDTCMAAAAIYQGRHALCQKSRAEAPARGSGQISLKDLSRLEELVKQQGVDGKLKFMHEMENANSHDDNKK
ncbi:hypothetical protein HAZT_HAZT007397 [Hyalella azteca]|uniref:Arginine-hydroxylase NDUFAF5, mitochondrial n=1 Tax=Hyalella azteca TaxID=294128 RepID=A0A6A0H3A2_HYAAZ|nr:hypothetical protein HAZT_HAZT007397 [Hyalella azteca]